ncbi:MAG: hypothetical protein MZU97_19260 [Bacillus subtilis]|nr:hypothetical protein [Bacillus subtilis]
MIDAKRSAMLHAVCGAGKTEILFEPFPELCLERGGKRLPGDSATRYCPRIGQAD